MPDVMCATVCALSPRCRRSMEVTRSAYKQAWAQFPGGPDCPEFLPADDYERGTAAAAQAVERAREGRGEGEPATTFHHPV